MEVLRKIKNSKVFKIIVGLLVVIVPLLLEKFVYTSEPFDVDRFIIFFVVCLVIALHLILDIKKMWDFIYRFRYLLLILVFIFTVSMGYHGSSLGIYDDIIEPSTHIKGGTPIVGVTRAIRSDEWMAGTLVTLSQTRPINNFGRINKTLSGTGIPINFYPRYIMKSYTLLISPKNWGYLFLPIKNAFSWAWYLNFFILFMGSFEFLMLITKKNKLLSFAGAMLIAASPSTQWWETTTVISCGEWGIVFLNKLLNSRSKKIRLLYSLLIGWICTIFALNLYPAWMIPYGYLFGGLVIYELIKNKGKYKFFDIFMIGIAAIAMIAIFIIPNYMDSSKVIKLMSNTVYPGSRFSVGGGGWQKLFNYVISLFLPFHVATNSSEASQFLSLYPIPFILGVYYIINNKSKKKKDGLLLFLVSIGFALSIWNYIRIPSFISKITFMYMSTTDRAQITVGYISVLIMIYCLANYSKQKPTDKYSKFVIALLVALFAIYVTSVGYGPLFTSKKKFISLVILLFLNYSVLLNTKKSVRNLSVVFVILSLLIGGTVHPISRGFDVIFEKPFAKEIQKISKKDPDALWISGNAPLTINNYLVANGARTYNSVNYYPNYKVWNVIDKDRKYEKYWNRFAHINVVIGKKEKTEVELVQSDLISLYLSNDDICNLNVKYISTTEALEKYSNSRLTFRNIYNNENMKIYRTNCSN